MKNNLQRSLSYWEIDSFFRQTDVLIIGAGIVGLNAAISIKRARPSWNIKVVDRGAIPAGASTRNAGFACFGSPSEILDDLTKASENQVFETVEKRFKGLSALKQELGEETIQYQACGGSEVFTASEATQYQRCLDQLDYLNVQSRAITGLERTYYPDPELLKKQQLPGFTYLLQNSAEGAIHPGKMMKALLDKATSLGVELLFGTNIETLRTSADHVELECNNFGSIKVDRVLVANNGFSKALFPELPLHKVRNQVWVTEPIPRLNLNGCFHYDRGYYYFRNIGKRILLGGGRHLDLEGEKTGVFGETALIQGALETILTKRILSSAQPMPAIEYKWSGILGVGDQKSPIVKRLDDRVAVAVRLGGMGVAIGTLIGQEAAQLMAE